jgi:hypothetical protein
MNLTTKQRQQIREIKDNFYSYCDKNLYIQDKQGLLVKFQPNSIQRKIIDYVITCLETKQPIRIIVLKARQEGVSTVVEAIIYWYTATHKNVWSKIVSHDRESAYNLYSMFSRYYENSHQFFKPSTKYKTKNDLLFNNEFNTGLNSQISISSAENTGTGRGLTIHWLHASEVAMWSNGAEILAGLLQTVPMNSNTAIFLESTANGIGDFFHSTWRAARDGNSAFTPFFFGWHEHTDYQIPTDPLEDLTTEEITLKKTYNLTDAQIKWRRTKIREFAGNEDKFAQEYPINEAEAFLASGRPRFNVPRLLEMEKECWEPGEFELVEKRPEKGTALTTSHLTITTPVKVPNASLKIWERPTEGVKYVMGADVSDTGEDNSVATIMRTDTTTTVARWCGDIEPADFGEELAILGKYYNNALIGVESNNHGLTTIQRLRDMRYMNLYRREKGIDERFESATSKLGWRTDRKTKPLMIDHLSEHITKETLKDYDKMFISECIDYVVDKKGKTNAQEGKHDDRVIATAIALQLFEGGAIVYRRKTSASYPNKYLQAKRNNRKLLNGKAKTR